MKFEFPPASLSMMLSDGLVIATGTTQPRTLSDRFADSRALEDFGAISAAGDATDAMIAAATWMRAQEDPEAASGISSTAVRLVLPNRRIVIEDSINLQGIDATAWTIDGHGCVIDARCTGKYLFDMLGSRWSHVDHLRVYGNETDVPAGVLLRGRLTSTTSADGHTLINPQFSGNFSDACIFDLASETNLIIGGEICNADATGNALCWISDGNNHRTANWSTKTDFTAPSMAQNTGMSNTQLTALGTTFRKQTAGDAVWLGNATGVKLVNCYTVSFDGSGVVIYDGSATQHNFDLNFLAETAGLVSTVRFERGVAGACNVKGFRLNATSSHASLAVIELGTNVSTLNIEQLDLCITTGTVTPSSGVFNTDSNVTAKGSIYVPASSWLDPSNMAAFYGVYDADDLLNPYHYNTRDFLGTTGLQTRMVNVPDDQVGSFTFPSTGKMLFVSCSTAAVTAVPRGIISVVGGAGLMTSIAMDTTAVTFTGTGTTPTGTTGTDGKTNFYFNGGTFYVENRTGSSRIYDFMWFGKT